MGPDPVTFDFDDYWYDASTVVVGDCYESVTGIITYTFSNWKLEPLVDGIEFCLVPTEETSFGTLKSIYR